MIYRYAFVIGLLCSYLTFSTHLASAQVTSIQKISDTQGGFTGILGNNDDFGFTVTVLGDLDGDLIPDLAIGAPGDDDGDFNHGAVYVLFMNADGTVKNHQKISSTLGGFTGSLDRADNFGWSVASLGDLDGDSVTDIAVGVYRDDDGGGSNGAVYILFLNADGTVKNHQKISDTTGGMAGAITDGSHFGVSISNLGDLDGDSVTDIVVGANSDEDGGDENGAVFILFLNTDGTVKSYQRINETQGGFTENLDDNDEFGYAVTTLGDLDGDSVIDIAVGSRYDEDDEDFDGSVYILFLNTDGTVKNTQKISHSQGNFTGHPGYQANFATSVAGIGDHDGDGVFDLAVGAPWYDDKGAIFLLYLNTDGTVKDYDFIAEDWGGLSLSLDDGDNISEGLGAIGDFNGDGNIDLAAGAESDDDGGSSRGAVYILTLVPNPPLPVSDHILSLQKISDTQGNFTVGLDDGDDFGVATAPLGDLDGDSVPDIVIGVKDDDDGGSNTGAVYVLFMNANGTVKSHQKISDLAGGFGGVLDSGESFGVSVASLGDLDGDGNTDIVVGAEDAEVAGTQYGAVYILFLNADGTVKSSQRITNANAGFAGSIEEGSDFGISVATIGDLDGDSVVDIVVGAKDDNDGGIERGAIYILFLNTDGTVKGHQKISDIQGGFSALLDDDDEFGVAVALIGDLDGDSVPDIAASTTDDDDGGDNRGATYVLFLNTDGTVKNTQKISLTQGNFINAPTNPSNFGATLSTLGDRDGDGLPDLAVGASEYKFKGAAYFLYLNADGTVKDFDIVAENSGGFDVRLDMDDTFGFGLALLDDIDGDGQPDFAFGAYRDDDGGSSRGAVYIANLAPTFPLYDGTTADGLLGQAKFNSSSSGQSASSLKRPSSVAIGPTGKVFISDSGNNRVLRWSSANSLINGSNAEAVLGQSNLTTGTANRGGPVAANTLYEPTGLFVTASGALYVADSRNNRILRFDNAETASNGANADAVLGQTNFTSNDANQGGAPSAGTLRWPIDVWIDASGTLWAADWLNHRVLRYDNVSAKANGASADAVLGQSSFGTDLRIWKGNTNASSFSYPSGVATDASGSLWVSDAGSSRVLRFDNAAAKANGANPDGVLGQANFTSWNTNRGNILPAANTLQWNHGGLHVDNRGRLWVADRWADRVLWFNNASSLLDGADANGQIGQPNFFSRDGSVSASRFNSVTDVFIDITDERVWVVDSGFNRVLWFNAFPSTVNQPPPQEAEERDEPAFPESFKLHQNYPNPFNISTTIGFTLPEAGPVRLSIYDLMGRQVTTLVDAQLSAGHHEITWNASNISSGLYLYHLQTAQGSDTKKMILLQ